MKVAGIRIARLLLLAAGAQALVACVGNPFRQRQIEADMAQSFDDIKRIYRQISEIRTVLDARLGEIQSKQEKDTELVLRGVAEIESKLDGLEENVGTLRATVEQLQVQAPQPEPDQVAIQVGQGDTASTVVVEGSQLLLEGRRALIRQDYESARAAFQEFLQRFPMSENRFEAHMGVAESYYRAGQWYQALQTFSEIEQRYPADPQVPEALLKMSICYQRLGQTQQAIAALERLINGYPNSLQVERARDRLQQLMQGQPRTPSAPGGIPETLPGMPPGGTPGTVPGVAPGTAPGATPGVIPGTTPTVSPQPVPLPATAPME